MTIDWVLLLLVAGAGYMARWAQEELGSLNLWFLPYRERCRRGPPVGKCKNRVWRIRWSPLAPLSVVCGSCARAERERKVGS